MKQISRKKNALERQDLYKTGGGPPRTEDPKDSVDSLLMEVVNKKTICGLENPYDNDNIEVTGLPIAVSNTSDAAPCVVLGLTYLHSQQISREDPCDFCLCLDGEVFCWWQQQCINNTLQQQQQQRTTQTADNTTTTVEKDDWVEGENSTEVSAVISTTCRVMGVEYKLGEILPRETGTCLQCQCGKGARVTCSPKDCASPDQFRALEQQSLDMFDVDVF